VRKVTNGVIRTIAGSGLFNGFGNGGPATDAYLTIPDGLAVGPDGAIFVSDGSQVRRISGSSIEAFAGDGTTGYSGDNGPAARAQFNSAGGLSFDAAGNLFITDIFNNCIRKVSAGVITTVAGDGTLGFGNGFAGDDGPALRAKINNPRGV